MSCKNSSGTNNTVVILGFIMLLGALLVFGNFMGQRQTQSMTIKGTVERWYIGKTITHDNERLVLIRGAGIIQDAYFEYYPPNAVTPVGFTVYFTHQFEFGGEIYILMSARMSYVEVVKVNVS